MKHRHTILTLIYAALLFVASCTIHEPQLKDIEGPPSFSSTIAKAPTVQFCDLISDPDRYDGQVVRTQAIYFRNMENQRLEDLACGNEGAFVWVEFNPSYVYTDEALKKKLQDVLCPSQPCPIGRARVTVVGRFHGPREGPYGHLGEYHFRFSLLRLEKVDPAEPLTGQR